MQSQPHTQSWRNALAALIQFLTRNFPAVLFLFLALAGMTAVFWFFSPAENSSTALAATGSLSAALSKPLPAKPVTQRLQQSPGPLRIGIISGHKGSDAGAVCDDSGLTEVDVNATIANQVAQNLRAQGITVDVLDEFDPRLDGYVATALISIHADSCVYYNELATGFKIAGSSFTDSSALFNCVEQAYARITELPYHANTITPHMTDYHAFREIAPGTPAIIIETGFLQLDENVLTSREGKPAKGITEGILCFLNQ